MNRFTSIGLGFCVVVVLLTVFNFLNLNISDKFVIKFRLNCFDNKWCFIKVSDGSKIVSYNNFDEKMYFLQIKNTPDCWKRNLLRFRNIESNEKICLINIEKLVDPQESKLYSVEIDKSLIEKNYKRIITKGLDRILENNFKNKEE